MSTIIYFERVPSAAVFAGPDGHLYARGAYRMVHDGARGILFGYSDPDEPGHMRRVSHEKGGEAYLHVGSAGDAIAPRCNLPFAISYEVKA